MVLLDGAFAFYFYTQWTFTLVIIYFLIAPFVSARGCWSNSKHFTADVENRGLLKRDVEENIDSTVNPETNLNGKAIRFGSSCQRGEIEQKAGILEYIMQITYQTSAGAVVLTDIVFWGLLVPFLSVEHFSLNLVGIYLKNLLGVSLQVYICFRGFAFHILFSGAAYMSPFSGPSMLAAFHAGNCWEVLTEIATTAPTISLLRQHFYRSFTQAKQALHKR